MKKRTTYILSKIILTCILCLFFSVNNCYAKEDYIDAAITTNKDSISLNISTKASETIYGFLGNINYDQDKLKLLECKSDKYSVSIENNILLLEGTKGYSNSNIATCTFSILKSGDIDSLNLTDISLSNSTKVLYNNDKTLKIDNPKTDENINNKEENNTPSNPDEGITNPGTYEQSLIIVFVVIIIALPIAVNINKKHKLFSYLIFLGLIAYPIYASATSRTIEINEAGITEIRNILLKKSNDNTNNKYDYDSDSKLTINDLIMALIDFNKEEKPEENEPEEDKTPPTIKSCTATIENNKTTITINTDDTDIAKYVVNDDTSLTFTTKSHTFDRAIENLKITAYDNKNNVTSVNCQTTIVEPKDYFDPIKPTGTEEIKYQEDKETIKVWIERKTRPGRISYYTTHIWVKDAYNQFKSQVPDNFGGELLNAKSLLDNAVKQQGLDNKIAVAVNASGFVLKGVWGQYFYNTNSKFNMTSGSPIVIVNGEVKRDLAGETIPAYGSLYYTYGMDKNGDLRSYVYPGGNDPTGNQAISQQIIADGVKNTFAFSPIIVKEGKVYSQATDRNVRQGFCQIDSNNFVFVTDVYADARNGFSMKELGEYMISLGCKTGFNLDGGGSTALVYKASNSTPVNITNPGRQIADIIYFHE